MRYVPLIIGLFLLTTTSTYAIYDPTSVDNNRVGIHIIDENDLDDAAKLVNGASGDWGYVKLVITEEDRKVDKWQAVFDRMRELRLIPIIRLATKVENGAWRKPRLEDIPTWVDFLDSLNWVVQNRYVTIFNEPNHAKEWGNQLNPEEYAVILKDLSIRLRERSQDFFILPAGLDASAPNGTDTMDELTFLRRAQTAVPEYFSLIDGWTSHSYPNPDFSGSPYARGRGSVRTYEWELAQIQKLGAPPLLPIVIGETGWKHSGGKTQERQYPSPETVATFYLDAFTSAWQHQQIIAVLPFLLNYQDEPFDHFSFKQLHSNDFYPAFSALETMAKVSGKPRQLDRVEINLEEFPSKLVTRSDYNLSIVIHNTGQSIIDEKYGWTIDAPSLPQGFSIAWDTIHAIKPFETRRLFFKLQTPANPTHFTLRVKLRKDNLIQSEAETFLRVVDPPKLSISTTQWFRKPTSGDNYQVIIYDQSDTVIHERNNVVFRNGLSIVDDLYNVIPGEKYRIVVVKPYYLPRQQTVVMGEIASDVILPTLLPLDPSNDGALSFLDVGAVFKNPLHFIGRLISL